MTPSVSPTSKTNSHHITLADSLGTIYGLILKESGNAINRRPKQSSNFVPFTQNDWSGGRGLKMATDDRSRFADAKRLNTRRPGQVTLGGLETFTSGHRQVEQHMPGDWGIKATVTGLTWRSLTTIYDYAHKVTASATGNRARIYIWLRRRGTPTGSITVELCADNAGDPGTVLKTVAETTDDIPDTVSQLYEFTFETVQAVTSGTSYWVRVRSTEAGTTDNCWQVGIDADDTKDLTKANFSGTWTNVGYDLYFRLVDDKDIQGCIFFIYKSQLYVISRSATAATAQLYMNGYRGVATGGGQSRTVLQDTTQSWAANELAGALLLIIDGPNSEWNISYRTISSNTSNTITVAARQPFGQAHVAGETVYVVLGTDVLTPLQTFPSMPTDVEDAGDVVYFAMGDAVQMRKMQERNVAGVWTRSFGVDANYAKLLLTYRDPVRGMMMIKGNDYDNSNRPSVSITKVISWWTRLKFPWLLDACNATTGWTAGANVTLTADTSTYQTGSASIRLACLTTAATILAYKTFTAFSLTGQKKIRLWVQSSVALTAGQVRLRLSAATDASVATLTDIDLPALDAGEWVSVLLPFKDTAGAGAGYIQSIGIIKNFGSTALDLYIDGIEAVPDGTEIPLGNDTERITGLELYGDPEVPWVFRSGSVGSIDNGTYQPIPLREYTQVENIHNGVGHLVHDVYLYFSFLQGLEQYYRSNLDDVGPNKDEGLPSNRQGYITSMAGYPDRFFYNYDAGTAGYSSIMTYKGGGHHEDYRCDSPGKRIRSIFVQIIPGDMADRLWFSEGEDIGYLPLPGNTVNELTDATYRFTHEGVLETAWIGDDQQRIFSAVKLGLENASADRCIEWDYKLDEATSWTPSSTAFTSGPVQSISLNVTGKRLKLRFRMQSNDNYETPRITSLNLSTTERPETRFSYSMNIVYQDNGRDLLNNVENYTRAETLIAQLDTWMRNQTPLTMRSISETFDNKTVYLEPVVLGPVSNEPGEQQEKLSATVIAVEPN